MNFENLIGPSACLAKQLELRWFYNWQITPMIAASGDDGEQPCSSSTNENQSNPVIPPISPPHEGQLVKKRIPAMPFLRRCMNCSRRGGLMTDTTANANQQRAIVRHDHCKRSKKMDLRWRKYSQSVDVISQIVSSSPHNSHANGASKRGKKKRKRGPPLKTVGTTCTGSQEENENNDSKKKRQDPMEPVKYPSPLLSAYELFLESPLVRQQIMEKIPPGLHHDDIFIQERLKGSWMELTKSNQSQEDVPVSHYSLKNDDCLPINEGDDKINSLAYWIQMEHKDKERFENEMERYRMPRKGEQPNSSSKPTPERPSSDCRSSANDVRARNIHGDECKEISKSLSTARTTLDLPFSADFPQLKTGDSKKHSNHYQHQQKNNLSSSQNANPQPTAYFHYLFMQPDNTAATFVERIDNRICPFCNFDGKNNEGLVLHCGRFHGVLARRSRHGHLTLFHPPLNDTGVMEVASFEDAGEGPSFEAALDEEGQLHVVVRGDPMRSSINSNPKNVNSKDFIFLGPKFTLMNSLSATAQMNNDKSSIIPFLQRPHHKAASLGLATRRKKLLSLQERDAPASVLSSYLPNNETPIRQYFHSRTNLPISHQEWMVDSDDEPDDSWLHQMSSDLMEEFEDVSKKEQRFMKLWNVFIKSHHVVADRDIPGKCQAFILKHRRQLIDGGLRMNLLLHLFNLWDSGVVSSGRIVACMELLA